MVEWLWLCSNKILWTLTMKFEFYVLCVMNYYSSFNFFLTIWKCENHFLAWGLCKNNSKLDLACGPSLPTPSWDHLPVMSWLIQLDLNLPTWYSFVIYFTSFSPFCLFSPSSSSSFFFFLGPHPQHMEGPRLGVESGLQLPAYTTAAATMGSKPHLRPTPQLTAMLDPWPTKRGQGSNLHLHGF